MSTIFYTDDPNGRIYVSPSTGGIYIMDEGKRRWIPDMPTLRQLYGCDPEIIESHVIDEVEAGPQVSYGAVCAKGPDSDTIYFIDNHMKRPIANPETLDHYQFSKGDVLRLPRQILLDFIQDGPLISLPTIGEISID